MLYWQFRKMLCLVAGLWRANGLKWYYKVSALYFGVTGAMSVLLNLFGGERFVYTAHVLVLLFAPLMWVVVVFSVVFFSKIWVWKSFEKRFSNSSEIPDWDRVAEFLSGSASAVHFSIMGTEIDRTDLVYAKRVFRDSVALANARFGAPNFSPKISAWVKASKEGGRS